MTTGGTVTSWKTWLIIVTVGRNCGCANASKWKPFPFDHRTARTSSQFSSLSSDTRITWRENHKVQFRLERVSCTGGPMELCFLCDLCLV